MPSIIIAGSTYDLPEGEGAPSKVNDYNEVLIALAAELALYDLTVDGPLVIGADTDASGTDGISFKTRNITRLTVNNDGTLTATGKKLTIGDATATDAARIDLKTQSTVLASFFTQTFNFSGTGPGGASYANHTFGLFYNPGEVAGDPTFSLSHEPKYSQSAAPYQTEIYYSWEDPTHSFSIRPWGMVIQHADGDNSFTMQGEIGLFRNLSNGGGQFGLWHDDGQLDLSFLSTGAITFQNDTGGVGWKNAAGSNTIYPVSVDGSDIVNIAPGGEAVNFGTGTITGNVFKAVQVAHQTTPTTLIGFDFSDIMYFMAGGAYVAVVASGYLEMRKPLVWETDNSEDIGKRGGTDFRPRNVYVGTDVVVGGVYKVGANQVVGARGAAVADATGAGDVVAQLNTLLARLRTHGLIAT